MEKLNNNNLIKEEVINRLIERLSDKYVMVDFRENLMTEDIEFIFKIHEVINKNGYGEN